MLLVFFLVTSSMDDVTRKNTSSMNEMSAVDVVFSSGTSLCLLSRNNEMMYYLGFTILFSCRLLSGGCRARKSAWPT